MGEPPDPGGTDPPNPPLGNTDTITNPMEILINVLESSMDTDCSTSESNRLKRKRISRHICGTCHKRKRKQGDGKEKPSDCKCVLNDNLQESQSLITNSSHSNPANIESRREPVGRTYYQASDAAPYIVHVQKETSVSNDGTTLHPVTFGRFLKRNQIKGIVNGSLKRVGRNRISFGFSNYQEANTFLLNQNLTSEKYKAFIPTFSITRMGVIRGVPMDWSDEEVLANINVPIGCGPIIKIRRIKRKMLVNNIKQFINTGTIVATFDGQILPTRVYMCYTTLPVDLYIYPTVQCYNCCKFGHVKNQCRLSARCYKCGQGHSGDTCNADEGDYWCCLCKGNHQATNNKCLEFSRQKAIKESMSKSCISYMEAVKLHPTVSKKSYADALLRTASPTSNISPISPNPASQSYKKTVFLKPKTLPTLSKGYDRIAHEEIIKEPTLSRNNLITQHNTHNDKKISDIIEVLIKLLSQSSSISPSNVAAVIDALYQITNNIYNNGSQSQSNSMELPQSKY